MTFSTPRAWEPQTLPPSRQPLQPSSLLALVMSCAGQYGLSGLQLINRLQQLAGAPGSLGTLVRRGSQLEPHIYSCCFTHTPRAASPALCPLHPSGTHSARSKLRGERRSLSFCVALKSNICHGRNSCSGNAEKAHLIGKVNQPGQTSLMP